MLALLAPGQGAQSPGFLTPWLELPGVAERLDWASYVIGRDLTWLGTAGSAEELRDTAVTQPLIVAVGAAVAAELDRPQLVSGHSVGEITAAAAAGALGFESAVVFARMRGRAMAEAADIEPTGMTAVMGGDLDAVREAVESCGLSIATVNGAGQVVAAGRLIDLDRLAEHLPAGARSRPLSVAGAFHTEFMAPARADLHRVADVLPVADPIVPLVGNEDGGIVTSGADLLARLMRIITAPVRWDRCVATLAAAGVTAYVELPPAGTLAGLVRREQKDATVLALQSPADLPAARELLAAHAPAHAEVHLPWQLVVAPSPGVVTSTVTPGQRLAPDTVVATLDGRREQVSVVAAYGGTVVEWLVADGDPVRPGQPLVRLHPDADA